jgi:hypothetical protein
LLASCCRGGARGLFPRARPRAGAAAFGIQLAGALALPHFPEHSGWGEGLDKPASSNLVVQRKLADDHEELGELGVGGGVGGGGQGVVLKAKLEAAGGGGRRRCDQGAQAAAASRYEGAAERGARHWCRTCCRYR